MGNVRNIKQQSQSKMKNHTHTHTHTHSKITWAWALLLWVIEEALCTALVLLGSENEAMRAGTVGKGGRAWAVGGFLGLEGAWGPEAWIKYLSLPDTKLGTWNTESNNPGNHHSRQEWSTPFFRFKTSEVWREEWPHSITFATNNAADLSPECIPELSPVFQEMLRSIVQPHDENHRELFKKNLPRPLRNAILRCYAMWRGTTELPTPSFCDLRGWAFRENIHLPPPGIPKNCR